MKKNISEKLMGMDELSWQRHANPLSVYTRIFTFPLFAFAIWSFNVWDVTSAIIFLLMISLWLWLNPRVFRIPKNTNNWASKVTFGERIWIKYDRSEIPSWHSVVFINSLLIISGVGFIGMIYFTYKKELGLFLFSSSLCFFGKTWYCDRMAWLFEDMKQKYPFSNWLK